MTMKKYWWSLALLAGVLSPVSLGADPEPASAVTRLATQRRDAARRTYEAMWANYRDRRAGEDTLYRWSVRWLEAEKFLSDQPADQQAACKAHYERMRELERIIRNLQRSGQATIDEVSATEYYRVEAELWMLQAKGEKKDR
jgi:hypothetical protein